VLTLAIIILTSAFSIYCMNDPALKYKYIFHPYSIYHFKQHYRFLSHAFIHADYFHLLFNMYALWMFGKALESDLLPNLLHSKFKAELFYAFLYTGGIYAASVTEFFRYRNDKVYSSLGASGAVNSVIFSCILFAPLGTIQLMLLPIPMYAWIFGVVFLVISYFLARRNRSGAGTGDNIGHEAHFWGAVFGFIATGLVDPACPHLFVVFFKSMFSWL
jgi:membrane associated rhomboid family serine protease